MKNDDYPALFVSSDDASRISQLKYLRYIASLLIIITAIGIIGSLPVDGKPKAALSVLSGILVIINFMLTNVVGSNKYEEVWFDGRVVAESVKSITWKFIMEAQPFNQSNAELIFKNQIKEINDFYIDSDITPRGHLIERPYITDRMKEIKSFSLEDKRLYYLEYRLRDQMNWYSSKSEQNQIDANRWKMGLYLLNFIMLSSTIASAVYPTFALSLTGILSAGAASLISWTQIKKFSELGISYKIAANELYHIINLSNPTDDFSEFVSDSENAISREHTNWVARKQTQK